MAHQTHSRHTATLDGNHKAHHVGADLAELAENAVQSIGSAAKVVGQKSVEARDQLSTVIKARPLTSVLVACAVGAFLARIIPRR